MRIMTLAVLALNALAPAHACPISAEQAQEIFGPSVKYIGETEKNLDSIFEGATAKLRALSLSFDEVDLLFGGRADPQARLGYANRPDVGYLLAHRGPAYPLNGLDRAAFTVGFGEKHRHAGLVVIDTAQGAVALSVRGVNRARAGAFAAAVQKACGQG
jgi:hypothetical protein